MIGGNPGPGQEPTGFSMTLLSTHGVDHHWEQYSNLLLRISLWSFQLMICISWLRQKWHHYSIQHMFLSFFACFGDGWQKNRVFFRKRWAAEEQESGVKGSFSPHLPSSAGDFKSLYECHFGDRMVFVPWQEISLSLIFWRCFPPMGGIDSHYIRYNPKRQSVRFVHPSIN